MDKKEVLMDLAERKKLMEEAAMKQKEI